MRQLVLTLLALGLLWWAPADAGKEILWKQCDWPGLETAVQHFSKVLSFKTVSDPAGRDHALHPDQFEALDAYLSSTYAEAFKALSVERLGAGNRSYLLTWRGSEPALLPALFISHVDVVPVTPDSLGDWTHPPFSGAVADGFIWGRGALDVKVGVVGLLEAATSLLRAGYAPRRTLLLAFGQDEEVGGDLGAAAIAAALAARGTQLEMIWDEGSAVMTSGFSFTDQPFAIVATAEKRYQTVQVTLHSAGGHSSMPPIDGSSVGERLGRLLTHMSSDPPAPRLEPPTSDFLDGLAPIAYPWLAAALAAARVLPGARTLLAAALARSGAEAAAMVRDTAAATMLSAGVADNVLPQVGSAAINFRLLPSSEPGAAERYVSRWLGPDAAAANISALPNPFGRPQVTPVGGEHFALLAAAIQSVWQYEWGPANALTPVTVVPYLMSGGTDSKHYQHLTKATLRFLPFTLGHDDVRRIHGTNERLSVDDFARALCTYRAGLLAIGGGEAPADEVGSCAAGDCGGGRVAAT